MSDSLQQMSIFAKVVASGSLSAAARELGLSPAVVSRSLSALETRPGTRLIHRTTRRLHLTDEGAAYFESCNRILEEIEEADAAAAAGRDEPQGVLRVALPASFGHLHVAPLVPQFAARYPKLQLALSLSDRRVKLIEEGFDLAVQIAELADSSLAARKLAPNRRVVCASPEYLRRHGTPRRVVRDELRRPVRRDMADRVDPGPFGGIARNGRAPVRLHAQFGQGPLHADRMPIEIDAPDIAGDASAKRRRAQDAARRQKAVLGKEGREGFVIGRRDHVHCCSRQSDRGRRARPGSDSVRDGAWCETSARAAQI